MSDAPDPARLIAKLKQSALEAIAPHVAPDVPVCLIDFPNHSNVGDSAIWLGELQLLSDLGHPSLAYTCDLEDYDAATLRMAAPEGTILINGGGNFGDLWVRHQDFRERVLVDFPDRPIVQLPQSIHFDSSERLDQARRAIARHRHFTLIARDHQSFERASIFECPSVLSPDCAFALGPLAIVQQPAHPLVALLRTDKTAVDMTEVASNFPDRTRSTDWLEEKTIEVAALGAFVHRREGVNEARRRMAEMRLARGLEILGSGRKVVTNRLHGHILSLLLGRPNFVIDNRIGKVGSFIKTWTIEDGLTRLGSHRREFLDWFDQPPET